MIIYLLGYTRIYKCIRISFTVIFILDNKYKFIADYTLINIDKKMKYKYIKYIGYDCFSLR